MRLGQRLCQDIRISYFLSPCTEFGIYFSELQCRFSGLPLEQHAIEVVQAIMEPDWRNSGFIFSGVGVWTDILIASSCRSVELWEWSPDRVKDVLKQCKLDKSWVDICPRRGHHPLLCAQRAVSSCSMFMSAEIVKSRLKQSTVTGEDK